MLHHIEHHQCRDALRIWRELVDCPAAVGRRNRRDPFGREVPEVAGAHRAALVLRNRQDRLCGRPLVETRGPTRRDAAERCCKIGVPEDLARPRRAALRQIGGRGVRLRGEFVRKARPVRRDDVADRKPLARVHDCRRQQIRERRRAELRSQRLPARDGARDGHRVNASLGHLRVAVRLQERRRQASGRAAAGVEPMKGSCPGFIYDRKQIAADAVRLRLDQAHDGVGRNRRINRVAAALEDLYSSLRRERLTGGDDAVLRCDSRSTDDDAHVSHPTHFSGWAVIEAAVTLRRRPRFTGGTAPVHDGLHCRPPRRTSVNVSWAPDLLFDVSFVRLRALRVFVATFVIN